MDQRAIERHLRRWRRDRTADDPRRDPAEVAAAERRLSATTGSGLSVESQVRKEWDPARGGGLPTFFWFDRDE
jgi:hypothetical protein